MVIDPLVFLVEKTRGVDSGSFNYLIPAARVDVNVISDVVHGAVDGKPGVLPSAMLAQLQGRDRPRPLYILVSLSLRLLIL